MPVSEGGVERHDVPAGRRDEVVEHRAQAGLHRRRSTLLDVARGVDRRRASEPDRDGHDHPARHRAEAEGDVDVRTAAGRASGRSPSSTRRRASSRSRRSRSRTTGSSSAVIRPWQPTAWPTTNEPRALAAALAGARRSPRAAAALAMHVANRHVERWAPETGAATRRGRCARSGSSIGWSRRGSRPRSARRRCGCSAQYSTQRRRRARAAAPVSWVFPRPWYQDELDWMAAARQVGAQTREQTQRRRC